MSDKPEKLIIVLQESVLQSLVKDILTYGGIAALLYFNHQYLDGNGWLDFFFVIFVILGLATRNNRWTFRGNKKEAIEWLKNK